MVKLEAVPRNVPFSQCQVLAVQLLLRFMRTVPGERQAQSPLRTREDPQPLFREIRWASMNVVTTNTPHNRLVLKAGRCDPADFPHTYTLSNLG